MKYSAIHILFLVASILCLESCSKREPTVEIVQLTADDQEFVARMLVLEIALPEIEQSIFHDKEPSFEMKKEIFNAGGSLVRDGRLLLLLAPPGWEPSGGFYAMVSPFEDWMKNNRTEKAWFWMDGGGIEMIAHEGDSSDGPIKTAWIAETLQYFEGN